MFGDLIAAYLFLGGTGGGACVVVGVLGLLVDGDDARRAARTRFRDGRGRLYGRLFGASLVAALGALGLGTLCLLADVGRPDRVHLLISSSPSTYLVIGAWALIACSAFALGALLVWRGVLAVGPRPLRLLHGLLTLAGVVTVVYTGLLLASMAAVPLWNSPWLVAVFALSGLSCGLALVLVAALVTNALAVFSTVARRLVRADTLVMAGEALVVALWLASVWWPAAQAGDGATATDQAALVSVLALTEGVLAPWLWLGLGAVGLALPAVLEALALRAPRLPSGFGSFGRAAALSAAPSAGLLLAASLCVLVGGACLRFLVIAAATVPVPIPSSLILLS